MTMLGERPLTLPDPFTALPRDDYRFSSAAVVAAEELLHLPADALFTRLLREQESEASLLIARRVVSAFLTAAPEPPAADGDSLALTVAAARAELVDTLPALDDDDVRLAVLSQRAPLMLLADCWLDMTSQPATQPAVVVNRLLDHQWRVRGHGNPQRAQEHLRHRQLEAAGVYLPELAAAEFLRAADARPLTAWHAVFYLCFSRLPANHLPELFGLHYAVHALGVDDLLLGTEPMLPEAELRDTLATYLELADEAARRRVAHGVAVAVALEREHVAALAELAAWRAGLSLESQVADIIARHAPMSGRQHGGIEIGDRLLRDHFANPGLDLASFLEQLRETEYVTGQVDGVAPLVRAMKFGGPMFGIFNQREAAVFRAWAESVQSGARPPIVITPNTVGDDAARRWQDAVAASAPLDVAVEEPVALEDRELFYRLVNIENHANMLPVAQRRAREHLAASELLFEHGAAGRYTDASWFDYTPEALYARGEAVYWDKLVNPYEPLTEIPDRDVVVFMQTTYALGSLIDGAWIHKMANTGHRSRATDAMLYSIYADEMGHGDLTKNHLTLIYRVLTSMDIHLPHIRDEAFRRQGDIPDELYPSGLFQLSMCLFPDTFYNEILGYNFGIEMFGAGEFRLHEIQKLRHYGFDDCYEQAHLAIDNFSAGHTKQAADIIVRYLDDVRRNGDEAAVQREWRRVWNGYAAFAAFVEHELVAAATSAGTAGGVDAPEDADLTI